MRSNVIQFNSPLCCRCGRYIQNARRHLLPGPQIFLPRSPGAQLRLARALNNALAGACQTHVIDGAPDRQDRNGADASSKNPCEHTCVDLHDGTYECTCFYGFTLAVDGYSCAKLAAPADNKLANDSGSAIAAPANRDPSSSAAALLKSTALITGANNNNRSAGPIANNTDRRAAAPPPSSATNSIGGDTISANDSLQNGPVQTLSRLSADSAPQSGPRGTAMSMQPPAPSATAYSAVGAEGECDEREPYPIGSPCPVRCDMMLRWSIVHRRQ